MGVPQFGRRLPGLDYGDRPAAFVVLEHTGRIACVRVALAGGRTRTDLPGGGVDPGESEMQAGVRECAEEAGLEVRIGGEPLVRADHYFLNPQGRPHNTRGVFFRAEFIAHTPELKTEEDHTLVWLEPLEALKALDRDSHVWALSVWLRGRVES
jgi:8-oxo-dGTP diphosphatase